MRGKSRREVFEAMRAIVSQERDVTAADKKRKDLLQARNLMTLLKKDRPGDLDIAWKALKDRGASWVKEIEAACKEGGIDF